MSRRDDVRRAEAELLEACLALVLAGDSEHQIGRVKREAAGYVQALFRARKCIRPPARRKPKKPALRAIAGGRSA